MKKCRYIPSGIPPEATSEHVLAILTAIRTRKILIVGSAARVAEYGWSLPVSAFVRAIRTHLESGFRLYCKSVESPPADTLFFQANINIRPEEDEAFDVYVELRLKRGVFVIVCDAHPHTSQPPLPK